MSRIVVALGVAAWLTAEGARVDAETWKVEQTLELREDPKAPSKTKVNLTLREQLGDEVTKEEEGRPVQVRRTWVSSKAVVGKGPAQPTALEGCVVLLDREAEGSSATVEKGTPGDNALALLKRGPPDPAQLLLPNGEVTAGVEWDVDAASVAAFLKSACAGLVGIPGEAGQVMMGDLDESEGVPLKFKVASMRGDEATVRFAGKGEAKVATGIEIKGAEGPPSVTIDVSGTLVFSVAKLRPLKLQWTEKRATKSSGAAEVAPGITASVWRFTGTRSLTRTFTPSR